MKIIFFLLLEIFLLYKVQPFSFLDLFEIHKYADVHWSADPCPTMLFSVIFSYQIDFFIFSFVKLFQITNSQRVCNFKQCIREPFKNYFWSGLRGMTPPPYGQPHRKKIFYGLPLSKLITSFCLFISFLRAE